MPLSLPSEPINRIGKRTPPGTVLTLRPGLRRIIAPNASAMTHWGTNSYILGEESDLCLIDPGPIDDAHQAALLAAIGGGRLTHIVVTHSHLDHSPLARSLSKMTGAKILAYGGPTDGRSTAMIAQVTNGLRSGGEGIDHAFEPDTKLPDGSRLNGAGWSLRVIHTPGHLGNHICLAWQDAIFTGDHVMDWSSTMVSPPDGDVAQFMASCQRLSRETARIYFPAHGAPVIEPLQRLRWLIDHRQARETQLLAALSQANRPIDIKLLTRMVYTDTPPNLLSPAERNVLAHLIDLEARNRVLRSALPNGDQFYSIT